MTRVTFCSTGRTRLYFRAVAWWCCQFLSYSCRRPLFVCLSGTLLQHVRLPSEDHPLNTVSLSLSSFMCHLFFHHLKVLCTFPAGGSVFGVVCLEAWIKSVNSVSSLLSLPQATFCMLASLLLLFFLMLSPPCGSSFFYLCGVSDALCSPCTDSPFLFLFLNNIWTLFIKKSVVTRGTII